jgi:tetratricopeptide (TPR) repeat protein
LHGRLFDLLSALGRFAEAHDHLLEATRLAEIGAEANEGNRKAEGSLGVQWNKLGEALASAGDLDRSAVSHARALGVFDRLVERSPEDARSRRHRAISLGFLGRRLDERGRPEEAGPVLERAVTDFASLVEADPRNARAREDLAVTCNHLGDAYGHLGCTEEALDLYLRALEIRREIVQLAGQDAWARRSLTISLELAAGSLRELGFLDRAAEFQRESFELARSLVDDEPQDVRARRRQVLACLGLADLEGRLADAGGAAGERLGRWRAAREWNSLGLEILETVRSRGGLQAADEDLVRQAREHLEERCEPALAGLGD